MQALKDFLLKFFNQTTVIGALVEASKLLIGVATKWLERYEEKNLKKKTKAFVDHKAQQIKKAEEYFADKTKRFEAIRERIKAWDQSR